MNETQGPRRVRSYVRREGRLTVGQERALRELWPRYGVDPGQALLDPERLFGRKAPLTLEIGFGNGLSLAEMAQAMPEHDFLGVEVYRPGIGRLLLELEARGLDNVCVIYGDGAEVLAYNIADASLDSVQIFFPDPWPKKRHHKRRLIQPGFVAILARKLRPGGRLHLATDWQDYALHMQAVLDREGRFRSLGGPDGLAEAPAYRPRTKFEARGEGLGHGVWDLLYERL